MGRHSVGLLVTTLISAAVLVVLPYHLTQQSHASSVHKNGGGAQRDADRASSFHSVLPQSAVASVATGQHADNVGHPPPSPPLFTRRDAAGIDALGGRMSSASVAGGASDSTTPWTGVGSHQPAAATPPPSEVWVVAYCLYGGENPRYTDGAFENARLMPQVRHAVHSFLRVALTPYRSVVHTSTVAMLSLTTHT
jgi:hypothetical protein